MCRYIAQIAESRTTTTQLPAGHSKLDIESLYDTILTRMAHCHYDHETDDPSLGMHGVDPKRTYTPLVCG